MSQVGLTFPRCALFLLLASCGGAGMRAVPVTAAPLPPDKVAAMRGDIAGSWELAEEMPHGGTARNKPEGRALLSFGPDGTARYRYHQTWLARDINADRTFKYELDGANVRFDPQWLVMRVDGVTADALDIFVYDLGYHWYFRRQPN